MSAEMASLPSISSTAFSRSWANSLTDGEDGLLSNGELEMLRHVNCSYLSSPRPPTLLSLKQHAQSLVALIQHLTLAGTQTVIGENGVTEAEKFQRNEAFDWLNDLSTPYTNDDESHNIPIGGIVNTVAREDERDGADACCPLRSAATPDTTGLPQSSHQSLVMHANECLERLDHEYSSTGGLMSVLPSAYDGDAAQLEAARNTLLGQWLLHHQSLINRLHELEINYTNAMEALEGRASAPLHADTSLDTDFQALSPTPQGEVIIVGNRKHAYERIHELLDRAEAHVESKQKLWWERGVSGERMWMQQRGGDWYARGLVPIDLETRFFRVKGQGHAGRLFMMPAVRQNAALTHLMDMEARPTVVSVVTPKWAERATALEASLKKKYVDGEGDGVEEGGPEGVSMGELNDVLRIRDAELEMAHIALSFYETRVGVDARDQITDMLDLVNIYKEKVKKLEEQLEGEVGEFADDFGNAAVG